MLCKKCGNEYWNVKCPHCEVLKNTIGKTDDSITISKTKIQMIIAGALVVIAFIMIVNEYTAYRQEQEIIRMMNIMGKQLEPTMEIYNDTLKSLNQSSKRMFEESRIAQEKMRERQRESKY